MYVTNVYKKNDTINEFMLTFIIRFGFQFENEIHV